MFVLVLAGKDKNIFPNATLVLDILCMDTSMRRYDRLIERNCFFLIFGAKINTYSGEFLIKLTLFGLTLSSILVILCGNIKDAHSRN